MRDRDDHLREYATDRQWEVLEAVWSVGSIAGAARDLGVERCTVQSALRAVAAKAARAGYAPDHDLTHPTPPGYALRGSSTLYDARTGAPIVQWVKTREDPEELERLMVERIKALAADLPRITPTSPPTATTDRLMVGYPIADLHLGMYAWGDETGGDDYDLGEAERLHHEALAYLVRNAPAADRAVIAFLGDIFHYDGLEPVTPRSKHQLDSDGRFAKMVRVGIRLIRRIISLALEKHGQVEVVVDDGNHDPSLAPFLREALAVIYEDEPRVTIDQSPASHHTIEFGSNLIGTHHGHQCKLEDLPLILATDHREAWGRTTHHTWWTGHTHKDRVLDVGGTRVESFKPIIPPDAYAASRWRSARGQVAITYHRDHGEVARSTVTPGMLA